MKENSVLTTTMMKMMGMEMTETSGRERMETVDTNIVLRYIIKDNPFQYRKVAKLLSDMTREFVVDDMAISEAIYVLTGDTYNCPRRDAVKYLNNFLEIPNVICHNRGMITDVFDLFVEHPKLSFNDCYMSIKAALALEEPLWTFDRALAKQLPTAELL